AGRSLEQIGALVGKHPSTVGYWLKKHGLVAANHERNAPKGIIDPDQFRQLVSLGLTRAELAAKLEISATTVSYWLRKLQLRTKGGVLIVETQLAREAGLRELSRDCRVHGLGVCSVTGRGR